MPTAPGTSRDVDQDQENQEQAQSPLESMMQRYAPDKLTQYQTALTLRDGASDDEARMAARRLSQVIIGVDSVDGQVWNRGVPFQTGRDYHAAMVKADNDLRTFAPQDLKEWNETEDMEKRFEIAKEKLGKFHGFRTGVENVVQQLNNPALTDDELRGAPEEIIQANEKVMAVTRTGKYGIWAGEPGTGRPFEVPAITEEEGRSALETVKQYREQRNKASIMAQYEGQLLSRNAWYHYLAARENWSPAADKIAQDVMKHGTMHPAQMDRFQTLPLPEQRELANFIHSAKRAGTANLPADMWQSFKDMLVDVPLDAARHATVDSVRRMFMDDDEYQRFAEQRAILNQLEAPKMAEYGYMGQSAIGFASTIPYMGYAAIPKVGISIVAAKAAADFEDRVAAEGGDVTSAKFIGAKWGMAYAYAAVEKMQAMRLGKPLSSLEYRQALLQFWRPANAAIVAKIVARNTVHETWEEGVQAAIEEGFVAWGLEKDIAKSAAGGLVQELKDTAGTMFLTSLAGAGGASVKARASKTHNINELITSQWHLMGLHDSMRNKDEKERKRHMQALGGIFRQWYEAGSHENAVEQFMARGMDRQTANELSGFIGMQHDAIMHDPDIQQSEKNAAFGLRRITPDVVRDIHPNATIADNGDGTFSISQDWNGKRVQFTVNQDWKPLQDINAANFAASVTEALQAVGEDMSVDKWTAMPEAEKLAMIEKYNIQVEGQFQVVAGDTSVTEGQAATLSGQIDLQENAHPATVFHEEAHGFYAFARRSGMFSEQDVQKLREEFGDPRPGVDEQFNEEAAADAWRDFAAGKTRFTQSGILERAFDWIQDTVSGIAKARRRAEKEQTTRDSLLMQMYRGEFTGIPVGTITEAQRRENAKAKEKAKPKPKKPAAKPQEAPAQEAEQAQEPSGAEIQPKGQAAEKPPSGEAVAGQGEDAESAAASADLDELEAPDVQPEATRQKLPGEHVAFTPGGEHQITAELVVVRRSDLIPSSDKRYPQRLQPRDVNAVGRRAQVHKIARNPQLSRIVEGSNTSDGYIYIDQNGNILSGNGRYAGISEAISIGTLTQAQLDAFMRNQAVKEGVVVPDGFSDILVVAMIRDLPDGLTLERFAELSNRNAILQRSEAETAEADAKTIIEKDLLKLFQPGADGNVLASSNQGFISALVQATGDASLVDSNNRPTEATRSRIRRALLAMLVGEGDNARDIVRGLVEDAKDLGMKTEVDGIVRASPDIVTVARDRPQYALLDEIGMALRMYMDMKREGSSPFQADLFGRPEAVDLIVKALWSRSSAGAIADIFSDYATRARLVDTSTAGLGLDKDPTKEELLKAAIAATGTGETAEQAQQKKAEEAAAESPEAPPHPTQEQRAIEKKGAAPTATGQELRDAIDAQATPEPAKYDPEPNAPPTTGDMKEALPNMDELRFWRETPTLPMSRNPDVLGAAKILPYMLAGNKSHIYAHHHDMFEAVVQGAPAFVDCFGGAATYLYNLANAGVLPDNSTWNEWEYTRHVTTKQIKENPEGVIAALDALSDRLEQAIPPGSRVGAEIDSTRDAIMDWLNAELRGEHGVAYVPAENAEDAEGRTVMLDTPESAALYLLVQNISYSARAQDVSMFEGKPTWTTAGDDAKLHPTDGKLLTLVDAKGKWGVSFRLAYPDDIIRKASKLMVEKNVNVTQRDGWSLASDLDVAPDGAVVTIDTSYFGAQNYGLKTREDGDMDTWLAKVRKYLLPHKDRLTFIITNNWNFHAVNELQKMGFLVARTERAGESPELVAMSGRARHIIAPAIRTVDYLGQRIEQAGSDQPRLSISAKGRKALTSGVYKDGSAEVLADLARLPASLKPYVAKYDDADELINLSGFAGWKPGPKVAPPHIWPYRPAVRLADGSIAWHDKARTHAQALQMWLEQEGRDIQTFDIDEYYGDGGLGPDGRYYEKAYIGDGVSDFVEGRETGRFSVQARQPAPAFYSQLRRVIEQKVPNRATVAQVRATIDPAKGSGVKADEVFWSGLGEWLDSKKPTDTVTKQEVLDATRDVVVTDVVKGGNPENNYFMIERNGTPWRMAHFDSEADAIDSYMREGGGTPEDDGYEIVEYGEKPEGETTKFASYQLPGGENYRELLLTLPEATVPPSTYTVKKAKNNDGWAVFNQDDRQISGGVLSRQDATRLAEQWAKDRRPLPDPNKPSFRSGHFSEPNIVAHVRFNERVSADGKRTLFIEEIQSDFAQKGREKGFKTRDEANADKVKAIRKEREQIVSEMKDIERREPIQRSKWYPPAKNRYKELQERLREINQIQSDEEQRDRIPPAPYVTKTDAWVSLALKRMVRWAAENGFEQVAWTTGEQQAERYDLSKQIGELAYWKDGDDYGLSALDPSGRVISSIDQLSVKQSELENTVGKEIAKRIIDDTGDSESQMGFPDEPGVKYLRGPDLKVGGEGMKGFYDKIVPTTANKLFKRFGARVGEAWFDLGDPENAVAPPPDDMVDEGGFTAHALPITPALRDSVLYEGQARFSVKAYPNLYRDVLSKHPASDKLDGNKAWLTLDGKWINVDEHRDAVPFDDGIYADIGVQEMAEAGLVRVHWVDFSGMPGGVMYAEHAPGQLTRAQRKELEDTAIERGGEVEYDPGQAWIRQPPPRYSFTAHAPKWSGNTTAIASLAVQHLMGEELNTEMAERSMRLHRVEDATADQLIAHAKKYAEGEVGKAAAKYLAGKDPSHAITTIAQQAELDAIAAAKEGIQTGLKMGRKAMKAEMDAEKRLIRDARGENLQTLIVDTGVDMGETMFQTLPELFSEWEKPKDEGPQQPEGPRQVQPEVEPPPADPAVLAERDRRMRNLIDAARAWGDQERAKREKLAEERRKAQQEAAEKGEKAEDTAEDEEGMEEADEVAIPRELLQAHGVDLRNSKELARFLRLWIADWIVRTSNGRLTHQTVWKDREAVEQYRKTMMEQMTEMGHRLVEPEGYALVHITTMIQEIPSTAKPDTIERRASAILSVIQANAIRQTRAQLVAEILKDIDREMVQHKHFQPMEQDIKRKVTGEHELTARYLKKILSWSPQKIDREVAEIQQKLADRTQIYQEDGKDGQPLNVSLDAEYHRNLMKLGVLQRWGGIKRKLPAEIKQAGIEIRGWTAKAQERLYARWLKHQKAVAALVDAMNDGIVPDNPDQARKVWGAIEDWSQSNLVHLRHRLEGLIRQQHDPVKRQKAMDAIDEIMYQITRGTEVYRTLHHKYVTQFQDAVREVSGGTVASAIEYMKHLEEEIDPDIAVQISRQGFNGEDGGQVMTYNQAMQLYAELTQRHYAGNVKRHKREEHADLIESILTTADLKLINRLRQIYEARRKELSEAVQQITGLPVWRPDPLYMPVRVLMGPKGGLGVIGNPQSWQPLAKSLTPRQHHGRDFDETATLTGTFYDSAEDAARAIGYGVRGLTVRGVLGNRAIQENIERYYGGDRLREMLKQTTHALDGVPKTGRDANDKLVNRIRELNAYAALSWNPLTAMKQTISFPMFAAVLPDGFVGVAKAIANFDKEALRELMESDWYKARYKGGINPEVAEILADSRSGYIAKFYKAGMSLVQIGDFVPSAVAATGIYRAKRDAFIDQGMDPEQAKQRASTLTGELIELTQQSSRPENMPNVYREGTGWGKLFLQFASAPLSQFSHEFHAAQDFRAGVEGSGARLVRTVMLNHVIIPGLLHMVTSLFHFLIGRPPKEDEPLFLMLLDHAIGGAMSRLLIVGAIAETVYDAAVEGKISFGAGRMVPAEALTRTIAYGIRSARDLLWEQDMEAFLSDLWKMLEGMSAPLRYGGELYRNRIAQ